MKKNSICRKVLAVILSAVILIGGFMSNDMFSPVVSAEIINSTTISIGDSITLGTYNNKKMTWTCIAVDDNGALMLASEIICTKEYDAFGKSQEYHSDGWGYIRENYGSNCWQDSNIRQWLNSSGSVNYSHCSPSYANEKGFLSCFSNEELAYILDTTQKTYVNEWEIYRNGYVDGGSKETDDYDISDVENAYYKNLTDKFFLLGQEQIMKGQKNVPHILRIGEEYFTRMANNSGASYENVITVKGSEKDYSVSIDTNGLGHKNAATPCGIRPAFYLKNNTQVSEKLKNNSKISVDKIVLGGKVNVTAKASGGNGGYTYAIYYKKKAESKWTTVQNFNTNTTATFKPAYATDYDVCVKVKDSNGTIVKKSFTVNVFAPLKNTTTVSSTSIGYGGTFTVKAKATGGLGDYTYAVYYKKASATKWTTAQNYSSTKTVTIKPKYAEEYDVSVKVKDSRGVVAKKKENLQDKSNKAYQYFKSGFYNNNSWKYY